MSRAVWQLGQVVRECGIALERAGARLSTDFSFTEPCESRAPAACLRLLVPCFQSRTLARSLADRKPEDR